MRALVNFKLLFAQNSIKNGKVCAISFDVANVIAVCLMLAHNLLIRATNLPNTCPCSAIGVGLLRLAQGNDLFTNRQMVTGFVECFECSHGCRSLSSCCCCVPIVPECNGGLFPIPINEWRSCDATNARLLVY